jgi:maltodextrin utilization protein YvdJ
MAEHAPKWPRDKRPKVWLDAVTVGSALTCLYSVSGMTFYYLWARLDSSMVWMWDFKRRFYLCVLAVAFVIGAPLWVLFIRDRIRNRRNG